MIPVGQVTLAYRDTMSKSKKGNPFRVDARRAIAAQLAEEGRTIAVHALRSTEPTDRFVNFSGSRGFTLSFPLVYGGQPATYEVVPGHVDNRLTGSLFVAAWRKGNRYGIGVVRCVHNEFPLRFRTEDGTFLDQVRDDWLLIGSVLSVQLKGRAVADSEGIRINDQGAPVFHAEPIEIEEQGE